MRMSDTVLQHVRKLMALADLADGEDDGVADKASSKAYLNTLVQRAKEAHCDEYASFLDKVGKALESMRKDSFDTAESRWYASESLIEDKLAKELKKTTDGTALLAVKSVPVPCDEIDLSLPPALRTKVQKSRS